MLIAGTILDVKAQQPEFPGMPEAKAPRKGTLAWAKWEWKRMLSLNAEEGALITPAMAAVVLNLSRIRVYQLMDSGQLKTFEVFGKKYLSGNQLEVFREMQRPTGIAIEDRDEWMKCHA